MSAHIKKAELFYLELGRKEKRATYNDPMHKDCN